MSSGHYALRYVECARSPSTATAQALDYNQIASRFHHDPSISHELAIAGTEPQLFLNVANVLNEQPPSVASAHPSLSSSLAAVRHDRSRRCRRGAVQVLSSY
jgi:hypothetical protein